jgi:enamine deaminase RidA (YjgF/YER057c/UK114 family)
LTRRLVSSGSPYEPVVGFSRAVRVGDHVFVAGTAPIMPGGADPPEDVYGQTRRCFDIILAALEEAGARAEDVVRTRIYLTDPRIGRVPAERTARSLPPFVPQMRSLSSRGSSTRAGSWRSK